MFRHAAEPDHADFLFHRRSPDDLTPYGR